jgi:RNA polymerase subunit RPABC4/transcription elongation factor Spt4
MPTYKHPCPYCGKFIDRAVAACPFCGVVEPFSPKRCQNCRRIVEDPTWVVCPGCGQSLVAPVQPAAGAPAGASGPAQPLQPPVSGPPAADGQPPAQAAPGGTPPPPPPPPPVSPLLPMPPAPVQAPVQGPICTGCGAPLPAGARFCTVCGTVVA